MLPVGTCLHVVVFLAYVVCVWEVNGKNGKRE